MFEPDSKGFPMTTTELPHFDGDPFEQIAGILEHLMETRQPSFTWAQIGQMHTLGRNEIPQLLAELAFELEGFDLFPADELAIAVEQAWTEAEFPARLLDKETWHNLFTQCGYIHDGTSRERPTESIQLYRGATPDTKAGASWTDNIEKAQWFARRPILFGKGEVYTASVEPARLFAYFNESRGESEYVIDTDDLEITEYTNN